MGFSNALQAARRRGLVSEPHFPRLGPALPFYAAICAVALPDGCRPPPDSDARISTGVAATRTAAARIALAEGVERYALQYARGRPPTLFPFAAAGGPLDPMPIEDLTLGAPAGSPTSSRGSATGATRSEAGRRAMLEQIEHLVIDRAGREPGVREIDVRTVASLRPYDEALAAQLRVLRAYLLGFGDGYCVTAAVCADRDGGRPTIASAADPVPERGLLHAAREAIFGWRNMVEIEHRAPDLSRYLPKSRAPLEIYRGAALPPAWLDAGTPGPLPPPPPKSREIMETLAALAGCRVRLFDMSVGAIESPVVRAVLG